MRNRRRGYSFPEVLFAVIVMGIGFIMIAAIFPVALQQNKVTNDESIGAAVARGAVSRIGRLAMDERAGTPIPFGQELFPATGGGALTDLRGRCRPIDRDYGWQAIRGSLIFPDDPRYAVVALYRRDGMPGDATRASWSSVAQIYLIVVQVRGLNRPAGATWGARAELAFDDADVSQPHTGTGATPITNPNNLAIRHVKIQLEDGGNAAADLIKVNANDASAPPMQSLAGAVDEGCYVVTAADRMTDGTPRIYKVGLRRTDLDAGNYMVWELQPGNDMRDATENETADVNAWVMGRERLPSGEFVGGTQDVSIYTTFIPVRP